MLSPPMGSSGMEEVAAAQKILNASVYNHQLCTVSADVLRVHKNSISDWKNEYLEECGACSRRADCGGFFSSSVLYRRSKQIRPFKEVRSQ